MFRLLLISSCLISAELQLNCLLLALGLQPGIPSLGGEGEEKKVLLADASQVGILFALTCGIEFNSVYELMQCVM